MRAEKKVIDSLNKCYAVAEFDFDGKRHLITAAEKTDPCYIYDLQGNKEGTLWDGPGGVMTLCQYPLADDSDPVLMATYKFYSPNDSAEAKIVYYTRENGQWLCHVLCDLPFVHRFGVVERGGIVMCAGCGAYETPEMLFVPHTGKLFCSACAEKQGVQGVRLPAAAVTALRHAVYADADKLFSFVLKEELWEPLSLASEQYVAYMTQKDYPTLQFYKSMVNGE